MGFFKKIFGGGGGGNKNNANNGNGNGKTSSSGGGGNRKNNKRNNNNSNSNNGSINVSINSSFAASEDVLPANSPSPQKFLTPSNGNNLNSSYSSAGRGGSGYHNGNSNNHQLQRQMMMTSPRGGSGSRGSNTSFDGSGMRRSSRPASINAIDLDEDGDDVLGAMNMNSPVVTPRQTQEELRAAYESSQRALKASGGSSGGSGKYRGFNENNSYSDYGNNISGSAYGNNSRLTPHQLQQWDMGGMPSSRPMFTMSSDIPRQQMEAMDDMNRSDASSSSFNLSTDAEDSEYETLRRRGVYPMPGTSTLDTSNALDNVSLSYTTDEDRSKIFPNLPTDDEMTQSTEPSLTYYPQPPPSLLGLDPSEIADSSHFPPTMDIQPSTNGTSLRPWNVQNPPMMSAPNSTSSVTAAPASSGRNNYSSPAKIAISTAVSPSSRSPPQSGLPSTTRSSTSRDHHFFGGGPDSSESPSPSPKALTTTASTPPPPSSSAAAAGGMNMNMRKAPPASSNANPNTSTSNTVSRNIPGTTPLEFTTPKEFISSPPKSSSQHGGDVRAGGFSSDFASDFGNFADFADFPSTNDGDWNEEKKEQRWEDVNDAGGPKMFSEQNGWGTATAAAAAGGVSTEQTDRSNNRNAAGLKETSGFDDSQFENAIVASSQASGSSSGFQQDRSLSDLLEAAKSKSHRRTGSRGNRISGRVSSGSVNSAPAITAAYLRQHHNLGQYSSGAYNNGPGGSTNDHNKSKGEATSVSDIIQSLEAMKPSGDAKFYSHRSVGETGAVSTVRLAKERLRERRRRSRERHGISNSRSADSDSDESDPQASESWLFDEVTGALGPRGIAADLESLSGRSNRSKNSHGGRSHKSSRRKSSRKSSSRRHRSDRSVDSHGSRTSRNSRYSHRSTKSYLSQMSEQSRSITNDLVRLEMQLAMVGSSEEKRDDATGRLGSGSASLGGSSLGGNRPSHRRSSSARAAGSSSAAFANSSSSLVIQRQKTKIIAPPGKLGIILANKSDSKGTVVSGVRETSVLVDQISQGDRIVAIDGEDVSRMTVSEITTIMSRKSEYERTLTVLTIPRTTESPGGGPSPTSTASPDNGGLGSPSNQQFDHRFGSFGR